jgi:hypothetical protein
MDATMTQKVEDLVIDLTDDNKIFTAFDVTKLLRNDGDKVRHSEVRDVVHNLFNDNAFPTYYTKTSTCIAPGIYAVVFYPDYEDINQYDPNGITAPVVKTPAPAVNQTPATNPTTPVTSITLFPSLVDSRGRYCIPAKIVREAQLQSGDTVLVSVNPKNISIELDTAKPLDPNTYYFYYVVDKSNNIRLSAKVLKEAGFSTNYMPLVKAANGVIEIK